MEVVSKGRSIRGLCVEPVKEFIAPPYRTGDVEGGTNRAKAVRLKSKHGRGVEGSGSLVMRLMMPLEVARP